MKTAKIGLLGFGNVGGGTYKILTENKEIIEERIGVSPEVVKILARSKGKKRFAEAPESIMTVDPDEILNNEDIYIVVEMLGGIEPATSFMLQAMKNGKHVVSANKAAIAANYEELVTTAKENNVEFLFEASVAGGIPVLAHPILYHFSDAKLENLVKELKEAGLVAIEAVYCTYNTAEERQIRGLASKYDLLISGGSDFHGTTKPGLDLAVGYGKLFIPYDILEKMKNYLNSH